MEAYNTVKKDATAQIVEKRSKFIASVFPISTREEAAAIIANIKKKYWDARHNVYAYSLKDGETKCSDDGEPSGTAGVPILEVLKKRQVTDCLIVVTRYFGGVLLGTGGLVRAYSAAASQGLKEAAVVTNEPAAVCSITCDYKDYEKALRIIKKHSAVIENENFEQTVTVEFYVKEQRFDLIDNEIKEAFCGQLSVNKSGRRYAFFE